MLFLFCLLLLSLSSLLVFVVGVVFVVVACLIMFAVLLNIISYNPVY